jgi:NhaP-type Na+/H+ or K+/H+ antiporter
LGTILVYAVLGTVISISFIGVALFYLGKKGYIDAFGFTESLAYGALISATDPVCILAAFKEYTTDPNFFLLVFGESVLNDAVSMVFYDTIAESNNPHEHDKSVFSSISQFLTILIGSTLVGYILGFIVSAVLKKITEDDRNAQRVEVGALVSLPWIAYLICHISGLSAIVVIFFMGISLSIYTKPYLSEATRGVRFIYLPLGGPYDLCRNRCFI